MKEEFKLPELGENVEKGDVIRVLVKAGDDVAKDQPVLELETDKATIEVPSSVSGTVAEVKVKAGEQVSVGQVVLVLEADGNGSGAKKGAEEKAASSPKDDEKAASSKKDDDEEAASSKKDEDAREPEDDADDDESSGDDTGKAEADDASDSGRSENVVDITSGRQSSPRAAAEAPPPKTGETIPAAPSVRRFARELGIDIAQVSGTGPGGRIAQDDVKQFVKAQMQGGRGAPGLAAPPLPDFSKWGDVDVQSMSNIRRKTAEHLSLAWQAPHVTQHDKADVTAFDEFREAYGKRVEKAGGKLTLTAVLIRLMAIAIDRFPQFASSVDMANESIVVKKYRHIGVAVDTPNGLLVPVIRDVGQKTISQIAVDLAEVSQKARDRKLSLADMSGGVMTITNLGGIGGTSFTPIVNQPEVAILGVSRASVEPVWRDDEFVPCQMLPLSLSYDHRVIDGADAARFLRFIAEGLEQPLSMFV